MPPIYFDYNATTPVDPRVLEAMRPYLSFAGIEGHALLAAIPEVAASTGAACHAGHPAPSAVLLALGIAPDLALSAVRFSLGRWTTQADVDRAIPLIAEQVTILKANEDSK